MTRRVLRYLPGPRVGTVVPGSGALAQRFAAIRAEFDVPDGFPRQVQAAAEAAASRTALPERDEREVPFVTLDPAGSSDLDQAMALDRDGSGYRVRYAIADVPAFVAAGGPMDLEARRRGQTIYLPDGRAPLHPPVLSEGAASLLPGHERPAFVWDIRLDDSGAVTSATVYRAMVRSRERWDYEAVQRSVDNGAGDPRWELLREIGERRAALELARGGASLPMPEQRVVDGPDGGYLLGYRPPVPAEDWNAQVSLLTGMAAAQLMVAGGVGLLRTMPPPGADAVRRFRREASALGVPWSTGEHYGSFLGRLDRSDPAHLALIHDATRLFRGAGYTPVEPTGAAAPHHAAVGAPYAHVTAPLRRLVDRFALVVCDALASGSPVPSWAAEALPQLPALMTASDRRAGAVERACTDAVEAAALSSRVGEDLEAVVVDESSGGRVVVQMLEPAIVARAQGAAEPGTGVRVRVVAADVPTSRVTLTVLP